MKISTKKLKSAVEITVNLDGKDLEGARVKALAKLAAGMKIAGFRKGKAPANVVEKQVDPNELASATLDIVIRGNLPKIFTEAEAQPLSMPNVAVTKYVPGESAEFVVTADILPEVDLSGYNKLKVKREKATVADADVEEVLERIAKGNAESKAVKRKAKLGDEVLIDFVGKKDGVAFEGGTAKDFKLELGSGSFIPGFEEGLVGVVAGDKRELPLEFPAEYHSKELAGAKVIFEVLVKQVNELVVPKLDDALAVKVGAFKTIKELRADVKKNLTAQAERRAEGKLKDDLVMELVKVSKVEAPASLVNEQVSEDQVKASIVMQELAKKLGVVAEDAEVEGKLAELRMVYGKQPEVLKQLDDPQVRADIANRVKVEKTLDALVKANS